MKIKNLNVYIIQSLNDDYVAKTISSLLDTTSSEVDINYVKIKELNQREETLNHILNIHNNKSDIFIVADDIVFIDGWFESLEKNYECGDIIGFSTLFPNTEIIQDYGYDFIEINNELTYEGLYKNENIKNADIKEPRICDSICGCAMFIKKSVLEKLSAFSLDGNNRIGEIIYTYQAKKKGFKTIVLDSFLYHGGISTKQNKNLNLSSISWLYEKDMWLSNVKKYFYDVSPQKSFTMKISNELISILNSSNDILIYGCGTIADFITEYKNNSKIKITSGLKEEIGKKFKNYEVLNVNELNLDYYKSIIISSIGYEDTIIKTHFNKINDSAKIIKLEKEVKNDSIILKVKI